MLSDRVLNLACNLARMMGPDGALPRPAREAAQGVLNYLAADMLEMERSALPPEMLIAPGEDGAPAINPTLISSRMARLGGVMAKAAAAGEADWGPAQSLHLLAEMVFQSAWVRDFERAAGPRHDLPPPDIAPQAGNVIAFPGPARRRTP